MAAVREGLADSEAGRVLEDEEVTRLLDERFGPLKKVRRHSGRTSTHNGPPFGTVEILGDVVGPVLPATDWEAESDPTPRAGSRTKRPQSGGSQES
ncbi:MAG: hypothetical protein QOF89_2385 [Acidobacteriota bacterium]|nr:hypothetical protein [Acidobacteriota bacterium]